MPNIKSAAKRAKQALVRRVKNRSGKAAIGTARRLFQNAVAANDKTLALKLFKDFCSLLDKTAKRGIITKNTADRRKSRAAMALGKMA